MVKAKFMFLALLLLGEICWARQAKHQRSNSVTQGYVLALSAADTFLFGWQNRDQNLALSVASPKLTTTWGEEHLRDYISGLSRPEHASFEIGPGALLQDGRYVFEARLYVHAYGDFETPGVPRLVRITLVKSGPERWLVDDVSPLEWE